MFQLESSEKGMNIVNVLPQRGNAPPVSAPPGQPQLVPRPGTASRLMARAHETPGTSSEVIEPTREAKTAIHLMTRAHRNPEPALHVMVRSHRSPNPDPHLIARARRNPRAGLPLKARAHRLTFLLLSSALPPNSELVLMTRAYLQQDPEPTVPRPVFPTICIQSGASILLVP
jgi:hypothetical protein